LLMILYTAFTNVDAINLHFCHGNLVDVAFNVPADPCCDARDHSAPCCTEKSIDVSDDDDQILQTVKLLEPVKSVDLLFWTCMHKDKNLTAGIDNTFFTDTSPPGEQAIPIYVLNTSYLFYG
jgi:hypothetical protein